MKKILLLILLIPCFALSQNGNSYYVSTSKTVKLTKEAGKKSKVIMELSKYDNLLMLEKGSTRKWAKVNFEGEIGFVRRNFIKKGKAILGYIEYRVGAKCRNGMTSSGTGKKACAINGGVKEWITKREQTIRIEN